MDRDAVMNSFMQWIDANESLLEGCAVVFGASDGHAVATVHGGHESDSPVYNDIFMRAIFNLETTRNEDGMYDCRRHTLERGDEDDSGNTH